MLGFGTIKLLRVNLKVIENLAPWIVVWGFPVEQESFLIQEISLIFDDSHKNVLSMQVINSTSVLIACPLPFHLCILWIFQ